MILWADGIITQVPLFLYKFAGVRIVPYISCYSFLFRANLSCILGRSVLIPAYKTIIYGRNGTVWGISVSTFRCSFIPAVRTED